MTVAADLRLGLIGLGRWGQVLARTALEVDGVEIARIATRHPSRVERLGLRADVTTDWREVVGAGDLDGVILAVPPMAQPEIIRAAIDVHVPVLAEKPLALDLSAAAEIQERADAEGVFVLVDHTQLFNPSFEAMRDLVRASGPIEAIDSAASGWGPFRRAVPVLWDWGPHDVAMCVDLMGAVPIESEAYVLESRSVQDGLAEHIRLRLVFGSGAIARCDLSNLATERSRSLAARVGGETLIFEDAGAHRLLREDAAGKRTIVETSSEAPVGRVLKAFASGLRVGWSNASLRLAVDVVRVLAQCEAGMTSGLEARRPMAL